MDDYRVPPLNQVSAYMPYLRAGRDAAAAPFPGRSDHSYFLHQAQGVKDCGDCRAFRLLLARS